MKKACLFLLSLLPCLVQAAPGPVKGWFYGSVIDGAIGLPGYAIIGSSKFAIGFPPPWGFGVGLNVFLLFSETLFTPRWKIFSHFFPISIYYVPYAKWDEEGRASPIIYSYFQINSWWSEIEFIDPPCHNFGSYMRVGIGCAQQAFHFLPSFEGGFYTFVGKGGEKVPITFYFGVRLSLGGWVGLGIK